MNNLLKFKETNYEIIYMIEDDTQGLVSVPKDLKNNIKVFMLFGDNNSSSEEKNNLSNTISEISKRINIDNENGLCIVAFLNNYAINSGDAISYTTELNKLKILVNNIYNKLLGNGNLTKENFIKEIQLLCNNDKYKNFIDFLCLQNPSKFHLNNYHELMSKTIVDNSINNASNNYNISSFYNNANTIAQPRNTEPINESLSIGNVPINYQYHSDVSSGGGPANNITNSKTLVKKLPNNAAFIKLPTIILIVVMSLVIGIVISISLLK